VLGLPAQEHLAATFEHHPLRQDLLDGGRKFWSGGRSRVTQQRPFPTPPSEPASRFQASGSPVGTFRIMLSIRLACVYRVSEQFPLRPTASFVVALAIFATQLSWRSTLRLILSDAGCDGRQCFCCSVPHSSHCMCQHPVLSFRPGVPHSLGLCHRALAPRMRKRNPTPLGRRIGGFSVRGGHLAPCAAPVVSQASCRSACRLYGTLMLYFATSSCYGIASMTCLSHVHLCRGCRPAVSTPQTPKLLLNGR